MKPFIPPPLVALICALGMWIIAQATPDARFDFPYKSVIALIIGLTGLFIDLVSVRAFFQRKTTVNPLTPDRTATLVVDGLYKYSRNPMYVGMLMILIAWALRLGALIAFIGPIVYYFWITELQIKPEERALREKFGERYDAYCQRVRRWI